MNAVRFGVVDYVGWRMQTYVDGAPLKPTYHSIQYDGWSEDDAGYYRDVSHLNPIRLSLATQASYRDCAPPEDVCWAHKMHGLVQSEVYIPKIMYHYRYSPGDSTQKGVRRSRVGRRTMSQRRADKIWVRPDRPNATYTWFDYHPGSSE